MIASLRLTFAAALVACAGGVHAAPPFVTTSIMASGESIADVGIVNSPFYNNNQVIPCTGGRGVLKVAVNNTGQWLLQVDSPSGDTFADGTLISSTLPPTFLGYTPYVLEGTEGYLTAPTATSIAAPFGFTTNPCSALNPFYADNWVAAMAVSNSGSNAMMLRTLPSASADRVLDASSALFINTGAVVAQKGQPVNCAGLDAGTVWGDLTDLTATFGINTAEQLVVVGPVVELGVTKTAVIRITTNGAGGVTGSELLAKVGGLIGPGPETWSEISFGPNTAAINDAGSVIFSGRSSSGLTGLYKDGAFVAIENGPTPLPPKTWGSLLGVPLDLNNRGDFVFRALTSPTTDTWNELAPDAGEETDGQNGLANVPADSTVGNGALNKIVGSLSSDTDVDMYRIRITDPLTFSATTVPNPGAGFPGAAFDSMLYLIREPGNGTGVIARSDDAAPGVLQSTLNGTFVPAVGDYYLVVCTPKTRPLYSSFYFAAQLRRNEPCWVEDPGYISVGGGRVLWTDPSAGVIKRALSSSGAAEADAVVGVPQAPTIIPGASTVRGPLSIASTINKVYWLATESTGTTTIKRSNFDGSTIETIITPSASVSTFGATGIAVDAGANRLFWSRALNGEIWRSNLGGGTPEMIIKIPEEITVGVEGTFACKRLAAGAGFVFWTNPINSSIQRAPQNTVATSGEEVVTTIITGVLAEQLAVDAAAGKIYWTETAGNVIKRANLDGTAQETFLSTSRPLSIALDATNVYWSNGDDRVIRKSPIAAPAASTLVTLAADTGTTTQSHESSGNGFVAWERVAATTPGALPYQVKLTGAAPRTPDAIIAKNNTTSVAATYDPIPGRPNSRLTVVGSNLDSFKLSDRGDVLWRGSFFEPTIFTNFFQSALFFNNEPILLNGQVPPGFSDRLVFFFGGPQNVDYSKNGQWAVVAANMQIPPFNFTFQPDRALLLQFDLPPECAADFNLDGDVNPDDLGDFINCYFSVPPCEQADFSNDGDINPDDLGDFINIFFAGC